MGIGLVAYKGRQGWKGDFMYENYRIKQLEPLGAGVRALIRTGDKSDPEEYFDAAENGWIAKLAPCTDTEGNDFVMYCCMTPDGGQELLDADIWIVPERFCPYCGRSMGVSIMRKGSEKKYYCGHCDFLKNSNAGNEEA